MFCYYSLGMAACVIDWPVINEFVMQRITRKSFHDVTLCCLVRQWDGGNHVSAEVDTEDRDGAERQWNISDNEQ